jgi:parvulin-like peptidyl-prolyl isomerase
MALYVNGELVDEIVVDEEADRLRPQYEQVFVSTDTDEIEANEKQLLEWSRENVVERILLRQAAVNAPEPIDPAAVEEQYAQILEQAGGEEEFIKRTGIKPEDIDSVKSDIGSDLKLQRLIKSLTDGVEKPTSKQILREFEDNTERFTIPEMIRASHIVKHVEQGDDEATVAKARKELEEVLAEVRETGDFDGLAAKYSSCPENGGDLGFFPRGQMVQEFEDIAFEMESGQVSDVFQTQFGFHIAKVTEKRPSIPCKLEDVSEVIEKELLEAAQQKAIEKFVDAEKEKATIEEKNIIVD